MDLPREAKKRHDLTDAGAGKAFTAGDGDLALDFAGVELALPFVGEAEELGGTGDPGLLGWPGPAGPAGALGDGTDDLAGRHTAGQAADVAVVECPIRPKADLDCLFA